MFLDSNGDGVSTVADCLSSHAVTRFSVWIATDRNRDGSSARCSGDKPPNMLSYTFTILADSGSVAWLSAENLVPSLSIHLESHLSSTSYQDGYGGATPTPPGAYRLMSFDVSVLSGRPSLRIASASFGSTCLTADNDNTLTLGKEWLDTDGLPWRDGDGSQPYPSSLAIRSGVLYLGGHRLTAPFLIAFSSTGFSANGLKIERPVALQTTSQNPNDSIRDYLEREARVRYAAGLAKSQDSGSLLADIRDFFAASSIVISASVVDGVIQMRFKDLPDVQHRWTPGPPPDLEARARYESYAAYRRLVSIKAHLEQGGIVLCMTRDFVQLPTGNSAKLDLLIQRLQDGARLTTSESKTLESYVPRAALDELATPVQLSPASTSEEAKE